MNRLSAV